MDLDFKVDFVLLTFMWMLYNIILLVFFEMNRLLKVEKLTIFFHNVGRVENEKL